MSSVIGYENIFQTGIVTASSEATGYPVENAFDGLTWDYWKATALDAADGEVSLTVDAGAPLSIVNGYFALAAHNLHLIDAVVELQGSSDNFAADIVTIAHAEPTDGRVLMRTFSDKIFRYWRLLITFTPTSVPIIGIAMIGPSLVIDEGMEPGFVPPNFSFDDTIRVNNSNAGAFLGRSIIREGSKTRIRFSNADPAWMRNHWLPFLQHVRTRPFVFSWDPVNYPGEAAYCWSEKPPPDQPYSSPLYMDADLSVKALL